MEEVKKGPVPESRVDLMHDNGCAVSTDPLRVGIFFVPLTPSEGKKGEKRTRVTATGQKSFHVIISHNDFCTKRQMSHLSHFFSKPL